MRKRRVGVTARSREIVGNQATGTPQIDSEIAAPLVLRTPRGTVAAATTECGWKRGDTTGAEDNRQDPVPEKGCRIRIREREGVAKCGEDSAPDGAHEALPHTSPGGKPPETPGPLSLGLDSTEGRESVKGSQAAHNTRALDSFPPFPTRSRHEGKGASERRSCIAASRWSAPETKRKREALT